MHKGGVIYLCQGFLPCMTPSMDGWMDKSHDAIHGSIESPELKDGVIGGDHNEEREVSEHAEFETC